MALIISSGEHLLSMSSMPDTLLGAGNPAEGKPDPFFSFFLEDPDNKQVN